MVPISANLWAKLHFYLFIVIVFAATPSHAANTDNTTTVKPGLGENDGLQSEVKMLIDGIKENKEAREDFFNGKCSSSGGDVAFAYGMSKAWNEKFPGSNLACFDGKISGQFVHPNGFKCVFRGGQTIRYVFGSDKGLTYDENYNYPTVRVVVSDERNYVVYSINLDNPVQYEIQDFKLPSISTTPENIRKIHDFYEMEERPFGTPIVGMVNSLMLHPYYREVLVQFDSGGKNAGNDKQSKDKAKK